MASLAAAADAPQAKESTAPGEETLTARQGREMAELRERGRAAKKAARKEGKKRVAQVEAQFFQQELDLAARHRDELDAADEDDDDDDAATTAANETAAAPSPAVPETTTENGPKPPSTAEKKRAKAARKRSRAREREREKEAAAAEERREATLTSDRTLELRALEAKLSPLGLAVSEVAADGNCLFRAVEHQLAQHGEKRDHGSLRRDAAAYMRDHADDFLAFFVADDDDAQAAFDAHCAKLRDTSEWGGQPEILALSRFLHRPIWVHSRDAPTLKMGDDDGGENGAQVAPLQLTFHRHYFALGEHYNSVIPRSAADEASS